MKKYYSLMLVTTLLLAVVFTVNSYGFSPVFRDIPWGTEISELGPGYRTIEVRNPYPGVTTWINPSEDRRFGRLFAELIGYFTIDRKIIGVRILTQTNPDIVADQMFQDYGVFDIEGENGLYYWKFDNSYIILEERQKDIVITFWDRESFMKIIEED